MTPEQRFARWVQVAIVLFVLLFIYFMLADAFMPATPQARSLRQVTRTAPEVSGQVVEVNIDNNQRVAAGEVLFRLDPEPFRIAVAEAELSVEQARRENAELAASLAAARAELAAARSDAEEAARESRRVRTLIAQGSISRQRHDEIVAAARSAQASVDAAQARVHSLEVQRGTDGDTNLRVRQARNALASAELDLQRATVRAAQSGRISNLQLQRGDYVKVGEPVMANIGDSVDIIADFREKSLRHVEPGDGAWVAFDAWPGTVFPAHVVSRDAGILAGQIAADGNLADIPTTDRWVRDAQRLRLHLKLDPEPGEDLPGTPPSGARATVQLHPVDNRVARLLARVQIALLSGLHHVY